MNNLYNNTVHARPAKSKPEDEVNLLTPDKVKFYREKYNLKVERNLYNAVYAPFYRYEIREKNTCYGIYHLDGSNRLYFKWSYAHHYVGSIFKNVMTLDDAVRLTRETIDANPTRLNKDYQAGVRATLGRDYSHLTSRGTDILSPNGSKIIKRVTLKEFMEYKLEKNLKKFHGDKDMYSKGFLSCLDDPNHQIHE